jgi:hypothetical protein
MLANFAAYSQQACSTWQSKPHHNGLSGVPGEELYMVARRVHRRRIAVAGGAVLIGVAAFTAACGTSGNQAPSSTTTTTTTTTTTAPPPTSAAPAPTEKSINPTAGNLFTPSVLAPPAPTEPPGIHRNKN